MHLRENKEKPEKIHEVASETANTSPRIMRRLVHVDLKMSSFTLKKRQTLSGAVKQKRLVWSILEAKACGKIHRNVDDFKRFILRAWQGIPQE